MKLNVRLLLTLFSMTCWIQVGTTNADESVPVRQSKLSVDSAGPPQSLTLEDAARDDRWMGVSPREIRWALDGSGVFFRWNENPSAEDDPGLDPWFWVDRKGLTVNDVPWHETRKIPTAHVSWSQDGFSRSMGARRKPLHS